MESVRTGAGSKLEEGTGWFVSPLFLLSELLLFRLLLSVVFPLSELLLFRLFLSELLLRPELSLLLGLELRFLLVAVESLFFAAEFLFAAVLKLGLFDCDPAVNIEPHRGRKLARGVRPPPVSDRRSL